MEENKKIIRLFESLFDGDPWLDVTLLGTLEKITAANAAKKPATATNSIWETVNHVVSWRKVVLERIAGADADTPEHNYMLPVEDTSSEAWARALEKLKASQQQWLDFLASASAEQLSRPYLDSGYTVYDLVFGIMQHDTYHLGQIVLLAKYG